jgi:hypothetical protein
METNTEVKTDATTVAPAKPKRVIKTAGPKPAPKAKTVLKGTVAPVPAADKPAPAPKVNQHIAAGVKSSYAGLSDIFNDNRKTAIMVGATRSTSQLTERHQKALYSLRNAYADKSFGAKGFDNGILRDLLAAGLIRVSGGVKESQAGKDYWFDAEKPVMVTITAAGRDYGKPAAK